MHRMISYMYRMISYTYRMISYMYRMISYMYRMISYMYQIYRSKLTYHRGVRPTRGMVLFNIYISPTIR
jgi:hypothetical protein